MKAFVFPDERLASYARQVVWLAIDTEKALLDPERLRQVTAYTLEHFEQKTKRTQGYDYSVVTNVADVVGSRNKVSELKQASRVKGFNAIFATASIDAAKRYYLEFKRQQADLTPDQRLKVAADRFHFRQFRHDAIFD